MPTAKVKELTKKEKYWAEKGYRYLGIGKIEREGSGGGDEALFEMAEVLDEGSQRDKRRFFFSRERVKNGEPVSVDQNGHLAHPLMNQLCNWEKAHNGWDPLLWPQIIGLDGKWGPV
jgi:hypothetical protein